MSYRLLSLALQACEDPEALPVLGDAVLEDGWCDRRVGRLLDRLASADRSRQLHREGAACPTPEWASACAAVLLFRHWERGRWTWSGVLAASKPVPIESFEEILRNLYPQERIEGVAYQKSPFFGMLHRETDLTRLAGMQMVGDVLLIADPNCPRDRSFLISDGAGATTIIGGDR